MVKFDAKLLKKDFPIFQNKKNLVYLDNAATTQKPRSVIQSMVDFYENYNSNVHRSIHELGETSTCFFENSREIIAKFLNAESEEIIFTSGTTEGINFIADAWARQNIKKDDYIVTTQIEHHANFLPWLRICKNNGAKLKFLEIDTTNFFIKLPEANFWDKKIKLVSISASSNVLGEIWKENQLENIISIAHDIGALVLLDASQLAPYKKIDVKKLNIDFLVLSGHKMLGPTGIGILYIKKNLHDKVEPYKVGGSMVQAASFNDAIWKEAPYKFEAGTPAISQAIGLGAAVKYLNENVDFKEFEKHTAYLSSVLIDGLLKIKDMKIWGNIEQIKKSGHLVSFSLPDIHAHDISGFLGGLNISVRSGHHCAQPLANMLNLQSSVRASFYIYNTAQDVEIFLDKLNETVNFFRK
ncbi:cysteine desulfurase [Candidatus Dependentiae bacterium]|nr:cysteine desulfurase [Candidatus Dependentiae bacterium]MCG2756469.1 cysteine desulfurase [Candidatus Dependentiae bacterium]